MNKDSIYKLIGYKGEYNKEVKGNLRKLLKKYHPDHNNGKSEIFKQINDVKKELEHNSNNKEKNKKNVQSESNQSSENIYYYETRIKELLNKKKEIEQKIKNKDRIINKYTISFNNLNEKIIKNQENLCQNHDNINSLKSLKKRYIIYILSFIIAIICYLINKNSLFLFAIIFIVIIAILEVFHSYSIIQKIANNSNYYTGKNLELINQNKLLKEKINNNKQIIVDLKRDLIQCENDIRFYQNCIKNK